MSDEIRAGLAAADELLAEAVALHGPPTTADVARADAVLVSAGLTPLLSRRQGTDADY